MKSIALPLGLVGLSLSLAGCNTETQTTTARTATEELLVSSAADRAAEKLSAGIPPASNIFVDATNFDALDGKYAIEAIRDSLLRHGDRLIDAKANADVVVELRAGASAIDQRDTLIGIPSYNVPIPLSGTLALPELALYDKTTRQGVAKFGATAVDRRTGALIASTEPQFGYAHKSKYTVLLFFSWQRDDLIPKDQQDQTLTK